MKAKSLISLFGGILLLTFTSCTDPIQPNPNFDSQKNEVLAQFVFNVSTQAPGTKQSAEVVQATNSENFRGIQDGILLTMKQNSNSGTRGKIMEKDANMNKRFRLTDAVSPSASHESAYKRIYEMSLPLNTDVALFYGKARRGDKPSGFTGTEDEYFGALRDFDIDTVAGSTQIALKRRLLTRQDSINLRRVELVFTSILTSIMATNFSTGSGTHDGFSVVGAVDTFSFSGALTDFNQSDENGKGYPNFYWSDFYKFNSENQLISPLNSEEASPLEIKLGNLYHAMMVVRSDEIRAGSGEALLRTITDLWSIINEVRCATPTSYQEALAKEMAIRISTRLSGYFGASLPDNGGPVVISSTTPFQPISNIISNLQADVAKYWPVAGTSKKPNSSQLSDISSLPAKYSNFQQFPFAFNLPRGATHMKIYNSSEAKEVFYYPTSFDTSAMGTSGSYGPESYYYPPELLYFANSPLRTSDVDYRETGYDYPAATAWMNESEWSNWPSNFVKASTRSVALKDEVNYGVAVLATKVFYNTNGTDVSKRVESTGVDGKYIIYDNNHNIQLLSNPGLLPTEEPDNAIEVTGDSFILKGIIIGSQYIAVDWDMLHKSDSTCFIYDSYVPTAAQSIGSNAAMYTMVFDSFKGEVLNTGYRDTTQTQTTISVALEFQNNTGKDFYGNQNLIKDKGYFYLIGSLNPAMASSGAIWPNNHVVPPYKEGGESVHLQRVFIQDFMTNANFLIGKESLHGAYLTVPDLRSSSMTLGLAVDMNWSTGMSFNEIVLGY